MTPLLAILFVLGAMIGSFLNALIYRLPREISIVFPRSSCPSCKYTIPLYLNIPILGWLFLRGKCQNCKTKISPRYPLIELFTGLGFVFLFPGSLEQTELIFYGLYLIIFCIFITHFFIDIDFQILPDGLNLILAILFGGMGYYTLGWKQALIGGAIGFGFPLAITWIFYKIKGQIGLGGGDIKLYGALGLYLGPMGILNNIFLSCFCGSLFAGILMLLKIIKRDTPIPFGPFILFVASVQIFLPDFFAKIRGFLMPTI